MGAAEDVPDPSSRRDEEAEDAIDADLADRLAEIDDTLSGHSSTRDDAPVGVDDAETAAALADHLDVILRLRAAAERDKARAKPDMPPMPMSIGPFRIVREIGRGGCAIVHEAEDPRIKRRVALKVIRPDALLVPGSKERFLREAELAGRINHAHVVTVYEVGESDGLAYIAMELCSAGSLADWLGARPGPIEPRLTAEIVRDLAEATAHAHGQRVIHRDITPGNVLLAPDPHGRIEVEGVPCRAKLADFGLAMALADEGGAESARLTHQGTRMGTRAWMAPEQVDPQEFGPVGPLTDVHALGLLLDRLLTGTAPHAGRTDTETFKAILLGEPRPADEVVPRLPRDIVAAGLRSRAKRPEARYASAADFAADLRRFLAGDPTIARPRAGLERLVRQARKHAVALGGAGALGLAILAAMVAAGLYRERGEQAEADRLRQRADVQDKSFELWRLGNVKAALQTVATPELEATLPARWLAARTRAERQRLLDRADAASPFHAERADLYCLALADDGTVGVGGADGTLFLFAPGGDEPLLTIPAHNEINDIAFSPDGRIVATAGEDGAVRLWSREDGRRVAEIVSRKGLFTVAFAPHGDRIAFGGRERMVEVQAVDADGLPTGAVATYDPFTPWAGEQGDEPPDTQALVFLDDDTIAAASGPELVMIGAVGGEVTRRLRQTQGKIGQIVLSPDGSLLVTIGTDHSPYVWNRDTGELVRRLPLHPGWVQGCGFSPDGSRIVTGCRDGVIRIFDAASGAEKARMVGHADRTWDVAWEASGTILSSGADGTLRRWDPSSRADLAGFRDHSLGGGPVAALAPLGPPGEWLVAAVDAPARLCLAPDGDCRDVDAIRFAYPIRFASLPDRSRTVLADAVDPHALPRPDAGPSRLSILSRSTDGSLVASPLGPPAHHTSLSIPTRDTVTFGSKETLSTIDTETGATEAAATFPHAIDAIDATDQGPRRLAVGAGTSLHLLPCDDDGRPLGDRRRELVRGNGNFSDFVMALAWSPEGARIAYGIRDPEVRVIDATSGKRFGATITVGSTPLAIVWSRDGHSLVVADRDAVRLCNADTGVTIDEVRPGWPIATMGFEDAPGSPGMLLIGGGHDGGRLLTLPLGQ